MPENDLLLSVTTGNPIEKLSAMGSGRSIEGKDFPSDSKGGVGAR
jgi:hypothetical protein